MLSHAKLRIINNLKYNMIPSNEKEHHYIF